MTDVTLRIAYLAPTYARASDTFVRSEVVELRRRGHAVHTFSNRPPDDSQIVGEQVASERENTDYVLRHHPLRLLASILRMTFRRPRGMLRAARLALQARRPGIRSTVWHLAYFTQAAYLAERFDDLGIQVAHNHMPEPVGTTTMLAATWAGIPFTLTVHGPHTFYTPEHWALPLKLRHAAGVACITHFCRSQCMAWSDVADWPKFRIVHCGLDEAFHDAQPTPVPDTPRLVSIGRLCPEKGQPLLVEAIGQLKRDGIHAELLFIGDGPSRADIERVIEREGLHDRVQIAGWLPSDRVRQELLDSRAMVLPSFAEGLPVVIMEALALGRPVVTTRIAGIPELVEDGVNGWVEPPGDIASLADAIAEVVATPVDRLSQMGRRGSEAVAKQHNITSEVATLEAMFRDVVGEGEADTAVRAASPAGPPPGENPPATSQVSPPRSPGAG